MWVYFLDILCIHHHNQHISYYVCGNLIMWLATTGSILVGVILHIYYNFLYSKQKNI